MSQVKKINAEETYAVRQKVLRAGKPIETCYFDGDHDGSTAHFGCIEKQAIIAVVSVFKCKSNYFEDHTQYQVRGMAVLEIFQKKGFGEQLLNAAEAFCIQEKANLIWFNARETAVLFYKKAGYEVFGAAFTIPSVGIHFVMFKKIK